jgi:hypothetical protein
MIGELRPATNVRALYHMNSGAMLTDSSGNGYTLSNTNAGTGTVSADAASRFGSGADYGTSNNSTSGTGKRLTVANNLGIANVNNDWSMMGWFQITKAIASGDTQGYYFLTKDFASPNATTGFRYDYNAGTPRFHPFKWSPGNGVENYINYNITLPTNTWFHIAYIVESGYIKCYYNGYQIGSVAQTTTSGGSAYSDGLAIGANFYSNNLGNLSGKADEIVVLDRAMTAQEIRRYYAWSVGKL